MMNVAIICLALNIYFEARNQPVVGQIAVSEVVLNRVADHQYPNNVCDVIYQAEYKDGNNLPIRNRCQFSWYCDGKSDMPTDIDAYRWALVLSKRILSGEFAPLTNGALNYHSTTVKPEWLRKKRRVTKIGDHIFYKRKKK
jgi:spore germination cell wall hydrolase CwlJ-like protein